MSGLTEDSPSVAVAHEAGAAAREAAVADYWEVLMERLRVSRLLEPEFKAGTP